MCDVIPTSACRNEASRSSSVSGDKRGVAMNGKEAVGKCR